MTHARRYGLVLSLAGLLAGGGLALMGLRNDWSTSTVSAEGISETQVAVTGADTAPGALGLAIVVMAAALGVLAASARLRRWLGALTALLALGASGWVVLADPASARTAALDAAALSGTTVSWHDTWWRPITVIGFALAAVVGMWTAYSGPSWPTMGSRYDAPTAAREPDPSDLWKSLDEGIDPTEDEGE